VSLHNHCTKNTLHSPQFLPPSAANTLLGLLGAIAATDATHVGSTAQLLWGFVLLLTRMAALLQALLTELARIRRFGFSPREVEIAQAKLMADIESAYLERDQSYSTDVREEYVRHFLHGALTVSLLCFLHRACTGASRRYRLLDRVLHTCSALNNQDPHAWAQDSRPPDRVDPVRRRVRGGTRV